MATRHDVHVSKDANGWKTSQAGERISHHGTQGAAIERATTIAKRGRVDVVTFGRDGKIRSTDSYGNDPRSIHDTEQ